MGALQIQATKRRSLCHVFISHYPLIIFIISLNVLFHVCFDKPLVNYYNLPTYGEWYTHEDALPKLLYAAFQMTAYRRLLDSLTGSKKKLLVDRAK